MRYKTTTPVSIRWIICIVFIQEGRTILLYDILAIVLFTMLIKIQAGKFAKPKRIEKRNVCMFNI